MSHGVKSPIDIIQYDISYLSDKRGSIISSILCLNQFRCTIPITSLSAGCFLSVVIKNDR